MIAMLPKDPVMLMSLINTKLRDVYFSLDELCEDMDISKTELIEMLGKAGFSYDPETNQFK